MISFMRTLRFVASSAFLLLAACVTPAPPLFAPAADQTTPPPPADKAQIVFLSPGNLFSMLGHVYEVKGGQKELLGTVGPKTKMVVSVVPGNHLFMSNSVGFGHFLDANVDAGKRYYVLMRYVHGRGLQLRPIRNEGGDPEFATGNPKFREWLTETQIVTKTAETDGWLEKYKSFADDAQTRGWKEWQEKRPDQRAELTLNREDSVDR
ncbi:MAG: hypothetical protein QOD26_3403 [Betaproteobacteria bacterium]|jgi:hypothetical protein|nr:hypothetical protein [Betaproteobacteria bacterium]